MSLVACQRDSTLRSLETEVLACIPAAEGAHHVVLADTVLYPEGGGQPADHGTIGGVRVHDVQQRADQVVHHTSGPVPLGPTRVQVDWSRRLDHMQQHTGQHLLTALAQDHFGWSTTSFHLHARQPGAPTPRCDIEVDGEPGPRDLARLEGLVNQAILQDHLVRAIEVDRATYETMEVRSRGLPDAVRRVRLVEIEGIDTNTCGGTHLSRTGELQLMKLLGTERIRGGTRLFYAAGGRVLDLLGDCWTRAEALSRVLSEGPETHLDAVERLVERAKAAGKATRLLQLELAEHLGRSLASAPGPVVALHRDEGDTAFLNAIATHALVDGDERMLLLTAGRSEGTFLAAGPPARLAACADALLACLDARGGGRPGRLQGKAADLGARDRAAVLLGEAP